MSFVLDVAEMFQGAAAQSILVLANKKDEFDPNAVTPGPEGFFATAVFAAAVIGLGYLLVTRVRRSAYRHQARENIAAELASGAAGAAGAAGAQQAEPGGSQPDIEQPGGKVTGRKVPGGKQPGTEQPGTEQPGTEQPGTEQPGTEQPGTEQPGTEQPGTEQPGKA